MRPHWVPIRYTVVVLVIVFVILWSINRTTAGSPATAPELAADANAPTLDGDRAGALQQELAIHRKAAWERAINQSLGFGRDLEARYAENKPGYGEDHSRVAWGEVENWQEDVGRLLLDADYVVFDKAVDLAPVMDKPWNQRVAHHLEISNLEAARSTPLARMGGRRYSRAGTTVAPVVAR